MWISRHRAQPHHACALVLPDGIVHISWRIRIALAHPARLTRPPHPPPHSRSHRDARAVHVLLQILDRAPPQRTCPLPSLCIRILQLSGGCPSAASAVPLCTALKRTVMWRRSVDSKEKEHGSGTGRPGHGYVSARVAEDTGTTPTTST
eukprot:TRINITY_DN3266_c0_g1_i1.p3 TRINITY_DN3266_c0_g1~~TRINITY_DN3266_c0_g1_i1.p3  ORF type:complete len:149 (-),score=3.07 TRINITY_DN3266_c0_g1_i1:83-529(-)